MDIDTPVPKPFGKALNELEIPSLQQFDMSKALIDKVNIRLSEIADENHNTTHIDCRRIIGTNSDDWLFDEIHPKTEGYSAVAKTFDFFIAVVTQN